MRNHPFELAKDAIQKNNTHFAHRLLLDAIAVEPYDIRLWILLAWTTSNFKAAAGYFNQALHLQPDNPVAMDGLIWANEGKKKSKETPVLYNGIITIPAARAANRLFLDRPEAQKAAGLSPFLPIQEPFVWVNRLVASKNFLPLIYLFAFALAEIITMFVLPQVGLALHGILLFALIFQASYAQHTIKRRFFLSLALVPVVRLVGLALPMANIPIIYWYLAIGAPLYVSSITVARLSRMSWGMLGVNRRKLLLQCLVAVSGIGLGYVEFLFFKPTPLVAQLQWGQIWIPALILIVFSGLLEEFIFRGVMQSAAIQFLGWRGILYISLIFSVLHIGIRSTPNLLVAFAISLFYGFVVLRTGSILGVALSHSLMNIVVYLIYPFVISPSNVQVVFWDHVIQPLSGILTNAYTYLMMQVF